MVAMEAQIQMIDVKADAQSAAGKAMATDAQVSHSRTQAVVEEVIGKMERRLKAVEETLAAGALGVL